MNSAKHHYKKSMINHGAAETSIKNLSERNNKKLFRTKIRKIDNKFISLIILSSYLSCQVLIEYTAESPIVQ